MTPGTRSLHSFLALLASFAILFAPAPVEGPIAERARPLEAVDGRILAPTVREGRVALTAPVVRPSVQRRVWSPALVVGFLLLPVALAASWVGRRPRAVRHRPGLLHVLVVRGPPRITPA